SVTDDWRARIREYVGRGLTAIEVRETLAYLEGIEFNFPKGVPLNRKELRQVEIPLDAYKILKKALKPATLHTYESVAQTNNILGFGLYADIYICS
ncbi:MAG: hypothetical protein NT023_03180, partial [Armatimonadetes bacterium]|nr:hypothetical protein [Armatimonadota bacterium]